MYSITLEINQKCNLRCRYCYLGEKEGTRMTMDTALRAVELAFKQVKRQKDRTIWFDFIGGEPFIDFPMIKDLTAYIEERNQREGCKIIYSTTTNATILTEEMIDFLIEMDFLLKVSIDGKKEINDKNRIAIGNYSVHDRVVKALPLLWKYQKAVGKHVQVTNVITENNYENYFDTLVYLTDTLGFRYIDTAIDLFVDWKEDQILILEENMRKSLLYFFQKAKNNNGFIWSFFDTLMNTERQLKKFVYCGAGIITSYIRTDGGIYACPANLSEGSRIGHTDTGFDTEKVHIIRGLDGIENSKCNSCELYSSCTAKGCIMQSLAKNGSIHEPDPMLCRIVKIAHKLNMEYQELLSRVVIVEGA